MIAASANTTKAGKVNEDRGDPGALAICQNWPARCKWNASVLPN